MAQFTESRHINRSMWRDFMHSIDNSRGKFDKLHNPYIPIGIMYNVKRNGYRYIESPDERAYLTGKGVESDKREPDYYRAVAIRGDCFVPVRASDIKKVKMDYTHAGEACAHAQDDRERPTAREISRRALYSREVECDLFQTPVRFLGRLASWVFMTREEWDGLQRDGEQCAKDLSSRYGEAAKKAQEVHEIKWPEEDKRVQTCELKKIYDHMDDVREYNRVMARRWLDAVIYEKLTGDNTLYEWSSDLESIDENKRLYKVVERMRKTRPKIAYEIGAIKSSVLSDLENSPDFLKAKIQSRQMIEELVRPFLEKRLIWFDKKKHEVLEETLNGVSWSRQDWEEEQDKKLARSRSEGRQAFVELEEWKQAYEKEVKAIIEETQKIADPDKRRDELRDKLENLHTEKRAEYRNKLKNLHAEERIEKIEQGFTSDTFYLLYLWLTCRLCCREDEYF